MSKEQDAHPAIVLLATGIVLLCIYWGFGAKEWFKKAASTPDPVPVNKDAHALQKAAEEYR